MPIYLIIGALHYYLVQRYGVYKGEVKFSAIVNIVHDIGASA